MIAYLAFAKFAIETILKAKQELEIQLQNYYKTEPETLPHSKIPPQEPQDESADIHFQTRTSVTAPDMSI